MTWRLGRKFGDRRVVPIVWLHRRVAILTPVLHPKLLQWPSKVDHKAVEEEGLVWWIKVHFRCVGKDQLVGAVWGCVECSAWKRFLGCYSNMNHQPTEQVHGNDVSWCPLLSGPFSLTSCKRCSGTVLRNMTKFRLLTWSPNSPALSLIERLWDVLDQQVSSMLATKLLVPDTTAQQQRSGGPD